jgi:hypothetical protein
MVSLHCLTAMPSTAKHFTALDSQKIIANDVLFNSACSKRNLV